MHHVSSPFHIKSNQKHSCALLLLSRMALTAILGERGLCSTCSNMWKCSAASLQHQWGKVRWGKDYLCIPFHVEKCTHPPTLYMNCTDPWIQMYSPSSYLGSLMLWVISCNPTPFIFHNKLWIPRSHLPLWFPLSRCLFYCYFFYSHGSFPIFFTILLPSSWKNRS